MHAVMPIVIKKMWMTFTIMLMISLATSFRNRQILFFCIIAKYVKRNLSNSRETVVHALIPVLIKKNWVIFKKMVMIYLFISISMTFLTDVASWHFYMARQSL